MSDASIYPPLRLFCSHSWDHEQDKNGLHRLISAAWAEGKVWRDLAVSRDHPLHVSGGAELKQKLAQRIELSEVLIAFAGKYSSYSDWIEFEVATARKLGRPIIAVTPRGDDEHLSAVVLDHCNAQVGWNGKSVREAIVRLLPVDRRKSIAAGLRRCEVIAETAERHAQTRIAKRA